jgi:hypothetical protein
MQPLKKELSEIEIPTELIDLIDLVTELDEYDGRVKKKKEWKDIRNKCAEEANKLAKHKILSIIK